MKPWYLRKTFLTIAAIVVVLYTADAVYPTWSWECHGNSYTGNDRNLPLAAAEIPELGHDPGKRVRGVSHPKGCSIHANNLARRVFDWWYWS